MNVKNEELLRLRITTVATVLKLKRNCEVNSELEGLRKVLDIAERKKVKTGFSEDFAKAFETYKYMKKKYLDRIEEELLYL